MVGKRERKRERKRGGVQEKKSNGVRRNIDERVFFIVT